MGGRVYCFEGGGWVFIEMTSRGDFYFLNQLDNNKLEF